MISLDEAIDRLLHQRRVREAFLAGEPDGLDLSAEDREALSALDPAQLRLAAEAALDQVLRRRRLGSGRLVDVFAKSLEGQDPKEAVARFLDSPWGLAWKEQPWGDPRPSVEEAFGRHLLALGAPRRLALQEMLTGALQALLISPQPGFSLPAELQARGSAVFAVLEGSPPILLAAARGQLVRGAITPGLAAMLRAPSQEAALALASGHGLTGAVAQEALRRLDALGLAPPPA